MRAPLPLAIGLALLATPAIAQDVPAPAVADAAEPAPADPVAAQAEALQRELFAARAEITRLNALVANQGEMTTALAQCRERNDRLSAIGSELIAAYEQRYRRGKFLPFDTGRRKFEAELQAVGDTLYDNRVGAGPRPAPAAPAAPPVAAPEPAVPAEPAVPQE